MPLAISPHFTTEHFQEPPSLEAKVILFADRVRGWQLDIADWLQANPHAGFGILAVVSSYFEMIAKYEDGYTGVWEAKRYFKRGVKSVLGPHTEPAGASIPDPLLNLLYDEVRCGMYHTGITGPHVRISVAPGIPVIAMADEGMTLDPHQLVRVLQDHFSRYVATLLNPSNAQLRTNFEARFAGSTAGKRSGR